MDDTFPDLNRLRLDSLSPIIYSSNLHEFKKPTKPPRIKGDFLKGPIPLNWLGKAASLSGKSLAVALAIMFEVGRRGSKEIKLTTAILERFNVGRKAKYRALKQLEHASLISVNRAPRRNPIVTVLIMEED